VPEKVWSMPLSQSLQLQKRTYQDQYREVIIP